MHISFLFSRPTGPAYRPSLFIFFDFHVFRISRPRCLPEISAIDSGYSHWGSARDGPSSARACPPSRPSPPSPFFVEVQGTLFSSRSERGFSATTFLGARRVLWSRTPRHHETSSSVLSSCLTKPDGPRPLCGPRFLHDCQWGKGPEYGT